MRLAAGLTGLHFDAHGITLARLCRSLRGCRLQQHARQPMPAGTLDGHRVLDVGRLATALAAAYRVAGGAEPRVALALPAALVMSRRLGLPAAGAERAMTALVELEAARSLPQPLTDLWLDYRVDALRRDGTHGRMASQISVSLVAARRDDIAPRLEACLHAGLEPMIVTTEAEALVRGLAVLRRGRPQRSPLLAIAAETDRLSLHALSGAAVTYAHEQRTTADTQALAEAAVAALDVCLRATADDDPPPGRILLIGEPSATEPIQARLQTHTPHLPAERLHPPVLPLERRQARGRRTAAPEGCRLGLLLATGLAACRRQT
jgi:Tfp pilus assembly PilM family ATPase